ncbi:hypothetical protein GW17_00050292 [Ensete ventricosum]|nr:hypothetical protein GW17_00050292 [Ensete ventricosum]
MIVDSASPRSSDGADASVGFRINTAFEHPCFVSLLEMAAQEFGYRQKGVLRIPCDAQHFEQVLKMTAK